MSSMVRRLGSTAALLALLALLLAFPGSAGATITGGCTGEGHSTSSSANLTTETEWHMRSTDTAGGSGTSPAKMHSASVGAYALGIALPIASGTSEDGETTGAVEGVSVATYAILGARFTVAGSASGDGQCSGQITIILDDVNPLLTVLGGGGILLAIIALFVLIALSRGGGGCAQRISGGLFGLLGGLGGALAAEQFGFLDPTEIFGLLIVIAAAILGFVVPGLFGGGETPPAAPTSPPPSVGGRAEASAPEGTLGATATPDPGPLPDPGPQERPGSDGPYPGGAVGGGSAH